jgi:pimeloyl-ACP methyl ester carboxylesterase
LIVRAPKAGFRTALLVLHFLALPFLTLLSGCETVLAANAARVHPPQGKLVDVVAVSDKPARRIQIDCRGSGSPTVVFQSGGDMLGALAWSPVLDRVAQVSRACAYSRAGILWSDPAHGKFQPDEVAHDLHAALAAAGEKPPYLLVAHSRGGLYNMIFAGLYRKEIAGLVFADSSHPDQERRYSAAGLSTGDYVSASQEIGLAFGWTGLLRLIPYPSDASIDAMVKAFYPKSAAANAREARQRNATLDVAGRYRDLENWPVIVLARELPAETRARETQDAKNGYLLGSGAVPPDTSSAARRETIWRELQVDLATWSSHARLEVVPNSNHAFFFFQPDVIVAAVTEALTAARVEQRRSAPEGGAWSGLKSPEAEDLP